MPRARALTKEQEQEIKRDYTPKESVTSIGKRYGVHHSTIIRILDELYVPYVATRRSKTLPYGTLPAREHRIEDAAAKYKKHLEECFASIQVGQEVHYKNKPATVIQKTDNLVVLKVHKEYREAILSLNKADIAKGLIQNIA